MNKLNQALLSKGINFRDELTYRSPYCFDKTTGEETTINLSIFQKLCNIASRNELVGFSDHQGNSYVFLRRNHVGNGTIVPLRSEDSKNYFQAHYIDFWGSYENEIEHFSESLDSFLSLLEFVCLAPKCPSLIKINKHIKGGSDE